MSKQDHNYTRGNLLRATAGVGIAGGGTGAVTGAYLTDRERFPGNFAETGGFSLELATTTADSVENLDTFSDNDFKRTTEIEIDNLPDLKPEDDGIVRVGYRLHDAPGWVWVRATIGEESGLGGYLYMEIKDRPACGEGDGTDLFKESLPVAKLVDRGKRLGDDCATDKRACLDIEWKFDPEGADISKLSNKSLSLSLEFAAVQCRHTDSTENPWN